MRQFEMHRVSRTKQRYELQGRYVNDGGRPSETAVHTEVSNCRKVL